MIDVLVVDDHAAVRTGLVALLRREPGLVPVASATGMRDALAEAERSRPNVAIVDYNLAEGDGLTLCLRLRCLPVPPAVLIYSAFAGEGVALAARAAGADALVDKGASPDELFTTIRAAAAGRVAPPAIRREQMVAAEARLNREDLPVLALLLEGNPPHEVAEVLGLDPLELDGRLRGLLARLAGTTRLAV